MDAEIEKLITAGTISTAIGDKLARLKPGTFVQHKSWGFGRVANWDATIGNVVIDFVAKKSHQMQFQFAADTLMPMPDNHFLARKMTELAAVKNQAVTDPRGITQHILESLGGSATLMQIQQMLTPEIAANDAAFKAWWDKARKALKLDGRFLIPAKKTDPILFRAEAVAKSDDAFARWTAARRSKDQITALDEILKHIDEIEDAPTKLAPIIEAAVRAAGKAHKLDSSAALELLAAAEELSAAAKLPPPDPGVAGALRALERDLTTVLPPLNATRLRLVLRRFPVAFPDDWTRRATSLLPRFSGLRAPAEICRLLVDQSEDDALRAAFDHAIRGFIVTPEMLHWLASERSESPANEFVSPELLGTILSALERDSTNEVKRGTKLRELLTSDRELIPDLVSGVEPHRVRGVARTLLATPVFDELTRKSLLARILKVHPSLGEILSGGEQKQDDGPLIVSWTSMEKRKLEYDDLVKVKIPQNIKDISIARSYGDLRENFEFKSAKQMQGVLQRRRRELEGQLTSCRGTNFENVDASQVSIGTVVRFKGEGGEETYTILGAWDTDPEGGIVSYLAPGAQAMMGRKVGDKVQLNHGEHEIVEITGYVGPLAVVDEV